jgi:transmembrane sensor
MNKLSQIEVEPLSDQRWSKIERSLAERLALEAKGLSVPPRARSRWGGRAWLLAAALMGVFVGAVVAGPWRSERSVLEQPSRITTGANASHLALSGLSLDVEPDSAVVLGAETAQGLLIVVDRGSIVCQVAPRAHDAPLIVQAGATRVRVVGTRFSVTRLGESARVKVEEGVVEVSSRGETVRVRAGEEWPSGAARVDSAAPAVAPSGAPDESKRDTDASAQVATKGRTAESPVQDSVSAQKAPAASRQAVFEAATLLERTDPARASSLYASLEGGGDSWAQNALYARGRLAATRGNRGEARRVLERYLERFPNGKNAEDARAELTRLR